MKKMYCPWRGEYTTQTAHTKNENTTQEECVFCTRIAQDNDTENFIIKRGKDAVVFLNKYPYNAGHILIMPKKHIAHLHDLTPQARTEIMELLAHSEQIMKDTLKAHGVNIGINLGKAAGAGIPAHLHFHVLPRWIGDTNFLPTLADTKQISFDLHEIYEQLRKAF